MTNVWDGESRRAESGYALQADDHDEAPIPDLGVKDGNAERAAMAEVAPMRQELTYTSRAPI